MNFKEKAEEVANGLANSVVISEDESFQAMAGVIEQALKEAYRAGLTDAAFIADNTLDEGKVPLGRRIDKVIAEILRQKLKDLES